MKNNVSMLTGLAMVTLLGGNVEAAVALGNNTGAVAEGFLSKPCNATGGGSYNCGPGIVILDDASDFGVDVQLVDVNVAGGGSTGEAHVAFNGPVGLPVFRAAASGAVNEGAIAGTEGARKYRYTGTPGFLLTLTGTFHGVLSGIGAQMYGAVALLDSADVDTALLSDTYGSGFGLTGYFGESILPLDYDSDNATAAGAHTLIVAAQTTVNPGDTFWALGRFGGVGIDDSSFDGMNTGTLAFNTSDVAAVPLPAAAWLFAGALGLLGAMRRRSA